MQFTEEEILGALERSTEQDLIDAIETVTEKALGHRKTDRTSLYVCGDGFGFNIYCNDERTHFSIYAINGGRELFSLESDEPVDIGVVADRVSMAYVIAGYSDCTEDYDDEITQEELEAALDFNEVIAESKALMSSQDARDFWVCE